MKTRLLILCLFAVFSLQHLFAQEKYVDESFRMPAHPRILLMKGEEKTLMRNIRKDAIWMYLHKAILEEADSMLDLPVEERIMQGKRLLYVIHRILKRVFFCSYAYRMTGDDKYYQRAEKELLKAASFSDWNPSHFLDVGEMTMAMAIGYDWLYDRMPASTRKALEQAIVEKGFGPSFITKYNGFSRINSNWNQVCNAGLTFGALAVWDKAPDQAQQIINRAIKTVNLPMDLYSPDGVYPEGVMYWSYGTTFNIMFLSAIEKVFKTDFGLSAKPGFLKTGEFILHTTSPALNSFCHSDNQLKSFFQPAMFWFYEKTKDPSIIFTQSDFYKENGSKMLTGQRYAPVAMIWGASVPLSKGVEPKVLNWHGGGINPVCCMRSDWSDKAAYLAVKFGTPNYSHGHMDVGSFVYEKDGIKWAMDMGRDDYTKIEAKGVDLWNLKQSSQRWDVFRYNNLAHNTLAFNRHYQVTNGLSHFSNDSLLQAGLGKLTLDRGYCKIDNYVEKERQTSVVSDLTSVYLNQVKQVRRSISFVDKKDVVIEDEITPNEQFTMLTWTLVTETTPKVISDNEVLLEKNGKKLYVKVESQTPIRWSIRPATSEFTYDSPNPGVTIVSFDTDLKLKEKQLIKVFLVPDEDHVPSYSSVL